MSSSQKALVMNYDDSSNTFYDYALALIKHFYDKLQHQVPPKFENPSPEDANINLFLPYEKKNIHQTSRLQRTTFSLP